MGDELRGENLVHLNVRFSTETELKKIQDFLYEKSGQGVSFTGLVEAMANEVTIVTAVHNIKSNKGSRTAGVDKIKMDKYLQMPKDELILLIQSSFRNYRPKPARREYIEKSNGKKRPLGIHLLSCLPCDRPQSKQRCTGCMEKAVPQTVQLHAGVAEGALQSS